jgi:hypothetical protein
MAESILSGLRSASSSNDIDHFTIEAVCTPEKTKVSHSVT